MEADISVDPGGHAHGRAIRIGDMKDGAGGFATALMPKYVSTRPQTGRRQGVAEFPGLCAVGAAVIDVTTFR